MSVRPANTQISLGICPVWSESSVRLANTQISLGIRSIWSESSLCAQWVAEDPCFLHADSEDFDQTGWGHSHFVGFVVSQLIFSVLDIISI